MDHLNGSLLCMDISSSLIVKSHLEELDTLTHWVHHLGHEFGLAESDRYRLDLVLAEAVTNIMQNAYMDTVEHEITVILQFITQEEVDRLQIQIRDDGVPFDIVQHPEFVFPENLEVAQVGGLGIHLIRHYTNECHYQRDGEENVLTLIFYLGEP